MNYLIGDLQGCCDALEQLLARMAFSPSRDHAFFLGALVNRGPAWLKTLRRLRGLGGAATCLMGNHDLHLLDVALGVRPAGRSDTLGEIMEAPDRDAMINWLRQQRCEVFALQDLDEQPILPGPRQIAGAHEFLGVAREIHRPTLPSAGQRFGQRPHQLPADPGRHAPVVPPVVIAEVAVVEGECRLVVE